MAIYCNQTGYLPQSRKRAVMTAGEYFQVVKVSEGALDQIVMEAAAEDAGVDAASGDHVGIADFSPLEEEGIYYIQSEQGERSHHFRIGQDIYRPLQKDLLKALYYQRCGCALEKEYAGEYTHGCCHMGDAMLWTDHSVVKEVRGGWHDAGDYGRYISPAAVAVAHLLYAYRLFPDSFEETLHIPESGNGIPDVLNECRYELEWMLKMQDAEGGAYHKLTSERHADFVMPEKDQAQFYLFPVSSMATADYAAVMALASRVYGAFDRAFADKLYEAALRAYGWLETHPEYVGFKNPDTCNTGEYDDDCDLDERLWAAAEMLVTTGGSGCRKQVERLLAEDLTKTDFGWTDVSGFAALAILTDASCNASQETVDKLRQAVFAEADRLVAVAEQSGYGVAMEPEDYVWGSNMVVLNRGMLLVLAAIEAGQEAMCEAAEECGDTSAAVCGAAEERGDASAAVCGAAEECGDASAAVCGAAEERGDASAAGQEASGVGSPAEENDGDMRQEWWEKMRTYEQTALAQLDYLLGMNAVDYSYVTGYGEHAYKHPHNRPTESDGIALPMPGWVSGGPFKTPCDEVGRERIAPGTPPMKCYIDHAACYSLNEITIYWNSPAVFVTAYFNRMKE